MVDRAGVADPALTATVLELADVAAVAEDHVHASEISDRIDVRVGDLREGELPAGYDAFLLANVVHYYSPETNRDILQRIRAAAPSGAQLLLADFWTDSTHTQPRPAALMAGEFAVHLNDGDVYSVKEATAWLAETGWNLTRHAPLAGPISLLIAETTGAKQPVPRRSAAPADLASPECSTDPGFGTGPSQCQRQHTNHPANSLRSRFVGTGVRGMRHRRRVPLIAPERRYRPASPLQSATASGSSYGAVR